MDYIQEELLRQRRILSVLMTGSQRKEAEATENREDESLSAVQPVAERTGRLYTAWEAESALLVQAWTEHSEPLSAGIRKAGFRGVREEGWRGKEALITEELATPVRMVPYERAVPETSADAREISRSIQRDARRYDGGFSIY